MAQPHLEQLKMYGCSTADIDKDIAENPFSADLLMHCMAILSDAQHVMGRDPEQSRQFINKAKYILSRVRGQQMISLRNGELSTHTVGK